MVIAMIREKLSRSDVDSALALARDLAIVDLDGPSLARWLTERLRLVLRTEGAMIYTPVWDGGEFRIGQFGLSGLRDNREAVVQGGCDPDHAAARTCRRCAAA
jgi:hypothetical protein